jgi:hypothetical protein
MGLTMRDLLVHSVTPSEWAPAHRHDLRLCRCPRGAAPPETVLPPQYAVCGGTAPVPPVTEALAEETLGVGEWVWLLSEDGVQQNVLPYQIHAIARGPGGHRYGRFAETPTGWPLAQCTRADPPAEMLPPPCAVCGGTQRWEDEGILRCVTCWPLEGNRTPTGADASTSTPGTTISLRSSEALCDPCG